jgi:hypothetical protein
MARKKTSVEPVVIKTQPTRLKNLFEAAILESILGDYAQHFSWDGEEVVGAISRFEESAQSGLTELHLRLRDYPGDAAKVEAYLSVYHHDENRDIEGSLTDPNEEGEETHFVSVGMALIGDPTAVGLLQQSLHCILDGFSNSPYWPYGEAK